jgi:hypothetical protein
MQPTEYFKALVNRTQSGASPSDPASADSTTCEEVISLVYPDGRVTQMSLRPTLS